jgi:hypothetical protein
MLPLGSLRVRLVGALHAQQRRLLLLLLLQQQHAAWLLLAQQRAIQPGAAVNGVLLLLGMMHLPRGCIAAEQLLHRQRQGCCGWLLLMQ